MSLSFMYLFIFSLFNDAFSSSNYTAPNGTMINEYLFAEDTEEGDYGIT
jgi:hypothetical protein